MQKLILSIFILAQLSIAFAASPDLCRATRDKSLNEKGVASYIQEVINNYGLAIEPQEAGCAIHLAWNREKPVVANCDKIYTNAKSNYSNESGLTCILGQTKTLISDSSIRKDLEWIVNIPLLSQHVDIDLCGLVKPGQEATVPVGTLGFKISRKTSGCIAVDYKNKKCDQLLLTKTAVQCHAKSKAEALFTAAFTDADRLQVMNRLFISTPRPIGSTMETITLLQARMNPNIILNKGVSFEEIAKLSMRQQHPASGSVPSHAVDSK